jgi:transposase
MATAKNRGRCDRRKLRYPSDVTDDEWAHVEPMFLPAKRGGNKRHVDVREEMNGIMDILRLGCPWRAIPKDLPPHRTLLAYRDLGSYDRTLDRIHLAPNGECREQGGQASPTAASIDRHPSTTLRATRAFAALRSATIKLGGPIFRVTHGGALARTVVAATGTKTDTPVMDTPFNVQSVSQQVLRDQQVAAARLGELLWQLRRELWPEYGADHPECAGPAYERKQLGGGRQARILDGVGRRDHVAKILISETSPPKIATDWKPGAPTTHLCMSSFSLVISSLSSILSPAISALSSASRT